LLKEGRDFDGPVDRLLVLTGSVSARLGDAGFSGAGLGLALRPAGLDGISALRLGSRCEVDAWLVEVEVKDGGRRTEAENRVVDSSMLDWRTDDLDGDLE
jgi:hypothetical protein